MAERAAGFTDWAAQLKAALGQPIVAPGPSTPPATPAQPDPPAEAAAQPATPPAAPPATAPAAPPAGGLLSFLASSTETASAPDFGGPLLGSLGAGPAPEQPTGLLAALATPAAAPPEPPKPAAPVAAPKPVTPPAAPVAAPQPAIPPAAPAAAPKPAIPPAAPVAAPKPATPPAAPAAAPKPAIPPAAPAAAPKPATPPAAPAAAPKPATPPAAPAVTSAQAILSRTSALRPAPMRPSPPIARVAPAAPQAEAEPVAPDAQPADAPVAPVTLPADASPPEPDAVLAAPPPAAPAAASPAEPEAVPVAPAAPPPPAEPAAAASPSGPEAIPVAPAAPPPPAEPAAAAPVIDLEPAAEAIVWPDPEPDPLPAARFVRPSGTPAAPVLTPAPRPAPSAEHQGDKARPPVARFFGARPRPPQPLTQPDPLDEQAVAAAYLALTGAAMPAGARNFAADWVAMAQSIAQARGSWTALMIGVSNAEIAVTGAMAARARGLSPLLHATEAEAERFGRMQSRLQAAGLTDGETQLHQISVAAEPEQLHPHGALAQELIVQAPAWDLLRIGQRGLIAQLMNEADRLVTDRVRWLVLITNGRAEEAKAVTVLDRNGWRLMAERPATLALATPRRALRPGAQVWRGPKP